MTDPIETGPDDQDPLNLRFLRLLVTILTGVMIAGVVILVALIVIRVPARPTIELPDPFELPAGVVARAVTFGDNWVAVVTGDDRILILNGDGSIRQDIAIKPAP